MTDPASPSVKIRMLKKTDDRSRFCCGNIELDRFFQRFAGQNQFRHYIGTSYVASIDDQIAGFVTVSSGEITADELRKSTKKRLPNYPLPILRISRLAVDLKFQGLGLGKQLLKTAFKLALEMKCSYGCVGIVVDAKTEVVKYYQSLGFIPLEMVAGQLGDRPEPVTMFLSISVLSKSVSAKPE